MNVTDLRESGGHDTVRIFIYSHLVNTGVPPSSAEIAEHLDITRDAALDALRSLGAGKQVVLHPQTGEIWMAGPFSAVPTRFRVHGTSASWWANCAWDMLGIPAFTQQSVHIDASCPDCEEEMEVEVDAERGVVSGKGLVHFMLPARDWYRDIGFT